MRLTKEMRKTIVRNALLKSDFIKQHEKLIDRRATLCLNIRRCFLSDELMNEIETIIKESKIDGKYHNFIVVREPSRSSFTVNINGQYRTLHVDGYCSSELQYFTSHSSDIACGIYHRSTKVLKDEKLIEELFEIEKEQEKIDKGFHALKSSVTALVNSANTDNQLISKWPECKELIPDVPKPQSKELSINVSELNSVLGLPSNVA